jgi:hypothetical protein
MPDLNNLQRLGALKEPPLDEEGVDPRRRTAAMFPRFRSYVGAEGPADVERVGLRLVRSELTLGQEEVVHGLKPARRAGSIAASAAHRVVVEGQG